ncbi:MAG: ABC transporter substrate-binding protein [Alphaproteobacteria bacterium]|nr:ABC transporter substrate-binding protein [Alphaproteobacteria bacterium]
MPYLLLPLLFIFLSFPVHAQEPQPQHAISLHGTPKYSPDFKNVEYVNPDAPKGGTLKQHVVGTFDSLNPFIVKGTAAAGMSFIRSGLVYESLMQNAWDEPFTLYGILAESITVADDKSWVSFKLRDEARWHDGMPVTADDVIWTFETLSEKGQPFFKAYWGDVESITAKGDKEVMFTFSVKGNAELPLIIAEMSILPKHYWTAEGRAFDETSLEPPLGSGPYKVGKVDSGRSIEYVRNTDWWGKDLPFFKGMYNFDRLQYDYYRDDNVAHEAFLSHDYDVKEENTAKTWQERYTVAKGKQSQLKKEIIENERPAGMQAFIYNIRRPVFQDIRVREALGYAFDFEWSNKQFAYGDYIRTSSFFENSELASHVSLPSEDELKILEPVRNKIPSRVFTDIYKAPATDGSGEIRDNLRTGIKLLEEAGYTELSDDGIRYKTLEDGTKQLLKFEILHFSSTFERWVLPFVKNLKRMGVQADFRIIDTAQFQRRVDSFDFDILISGFGQSDSPGNEQREFWGSEKASVTGSRNYIGIQDPVIDDMIEGIIRATSREDLVTKTRAMDRVLLWNHYVIPMWHYPKWRIAYWNNIKRPDTLSGISPLISTTWWAAEPAAGK